MVVPSPSILITLTPFRMTGLMGALTIAVGFTIMAVMEATGGHNHSHGGGHSSHGLKANNVFIPVLGPLIGRLTIAALLLI